jgi:hypothetical protein
MIIVTMPNGADIKNEATSFKFERDTLVLKNGEVIVRVFPREKVDFVTPVPKKAD